MSSKSKSPLYLLLNRRSISEEGTICLLMSYAICFLVAGEIGLSSSSLIFYVISTIRLIYNHKSLLSLRISLWKMIVSLPNN